ncbi:MULTISPECIES: sugar ABC transporter ATP-binding protein [unclassified Microbacterium]|uniref:sugar ABC transporter ATP-binding protein n=1 Tax=unclassified Microbacterium TaxID=2609290 RepID=UPI00214C0E81|nr:MULTISPECIES: sugar ABC transporter ATP-binding protein [unclassified Microbacterium]MCR2810973.1 sugar ABC transporter ATP-binding protein [Microbacterium sp. zg.B185]WIM19629.1 sugar ABC transporter ATP-binding protein [Microbacterium sp. zg-B185]
MSADTAVGPVVEMTGITVRFPGVLALDAVDFTLRPGEVHALMGENGAGKSTLIKALTGVQAVDAGTIVVSGGPRRFSSTADAQSAGISTVYQEVNLCANLSVGENVMLGHERRRGAGIDWRATHREAAEHLGSLGLAIDTQSTLSSHSIAIQQLIAIGRAMVLDAKVLILDEPTSSLDRGEVEQLFTVIRDLRGRGVAILFVSHFLDQVYEISDRITVLRNGQLVGEYAIGRLPRGALVTKMIGRELDELAALASVADRTIDRTGTPVLKATGIGRRGVLEPADIAVYDGEVVGIAGLLGSGRTELVRLLYGADRSDSGQLEVGGRATRHTTPRHAIENRVAFSSENRRAEGIIADLTVAENIVLGIQARRGALRKVSRAEAEAVVAEYIAALGVRPAVPGMLAGNLSGGNQQKVLLARWLATAPKLIVLDEPTRGIDVGAKADIQRKVAELSAQGLSVVFISSELEEVLRLAQRVVVMRDRRKIGELDSSDVSIEGLIDYIADERQESVA